MKAYLIILYSILFPTFSQAQKILTGTVINDVSEPLIGATIQWENTTTGTTTDIDGKFQLEKPDGDGNIVVRYVGYEPLLIPVAAHEDTVLIQINGIASLSEIEVAAKKRDNYTSTLEIRNIESICSKELKKAPCCNLGESFETNASVDVSYTDAVTGAREIQMLGLRGVYTQLLFEKRPVYYGLAMPFGLEYLPGTWVESIQIAKGLSTIQTGSAGIAGQINTEMKKPYEDVPLFVNLFGSTAGRFEGNVHLNKKINENLSTGLLLHGNTLQSEIDHDGDSFLDMPKKKMLNALYRLNYGGKTFHTQFNIHGIMDNRRSGQIVPDAANPADYYQIGQDVSRLDVFGKFGFFGFKEAYKSMGLILSGTAHEMKSFYGRRRHEGSQNTFYANLMYNTIIVDSNNKLTLGASYQLDDYIEKLDDVDYSRRESMPGLWSEYQFEAQNFSNRKGWKSFGLVAGLRLDHHNQFGYLFAPQLSAKLNFTDESVLRISGGRGFRSASILAENISYLASSRQIVLTEPLDIEEAWSAGLNFTHNFHFAEREINFTFDLFRTDFINQIVLDVEQDYQHLYFYNLKGKSYSNSMLAVIGFEIVKGLDFKTGYKFNDVKMTIGDELVQRLLVAKHRGLVTLDYETPDKRWMFNTSLQWVGPQRLPDNSILPASVHVHNGDDTSPAYAMLNVQTTWKANDLWEFYVGAENLTNYRQHRPIIGDENPFGAYFDATQIYGPTMGVRGYAGLRFSLK